MPQTDLTCLGFKSAAAVIVFIFILSIFVYYNSIFIHTTWKVERRRKKFVLLYLKLLFNRKSIRNHVSQISDNLIKTI